MTSNAEQRREEEQRGRHTQTPWNIGALSRFSEQLGEPPRSCLVFTDNDNDLICDCYSFVAREDKEKEANAKFIVQAVNSYDHNKQLIADLVGALGEMREFALNIMDDPSRAQNIKVFKLTEETLAKARGQS